MSCQLVVMVRRFSQRWVCASIWWLTSLQLRCGGGMWCDLEAKLFGGLGGIFWAIRDSGPRFVIWNFAQYATQLWFLDVRIFTSECVYSMELFDLDLSSNHYLENVCALWITFSTWSFLTTVFYWKSIFLECACKGKLEKIWARFIGRVLLTNI